MITTETDDRIEKAIALLQEVKANMTPPIFLGIEDISARWRKEASACRRILEQEKIGVRLGEKKGCSVRYPLKEVIKLEQRWMDMRGGVK
ncbi:MAG: hypothetical protein AB7F75_09680 [Planctomycetota bacterium]